MKRTPLALAAIITSAALLLTGCSAAGSDADADTTSGSSSGSDASWPRTIEHELGSTEIPALPENIVSTSITLTGTLLAIDAPITATATTTPSDITDADGFFSQWADVAAERGVESLYPNLEFDEEAVLAAAPDLIVVSSSGADSTVDDYEALSAIAPTIVLNYGDKTWQDLAAQLGEATGHEDDAAAVVSAFDEHVKEVADSITVPAGTANAIVWNGTENPTAFAKPGSSHADLLDSLGFTIEGAPDEYDTSEQSRQDFAFLAVENVTTALTGEVVFLISGGDASESDLLSTPVLATAPAISAKQVYPLGANSFRIDYYSATEIVDIVAADFA